MNDYEKKLEDRKARLLNAAQKADEKATAHFEASHDVLKHIPLGQPILVGHHSEKHHRRDLKRSDDHMRKCFEESERAKELTYKAEGVGTGGISSDDPDAILKLEQQLAERIAFQERIKAENKVMKKHKFNPEKVAQELGITTERAQEIIGPDFCGRLGHASYILSNNNQRVRDIKNRIEALKKRDSLKDETIDGPGYTLKLDRAANRVYFFFDGKPEDEIRTQLKKMAFKWTPSVGAWGRKITPNAIYDARLFHKKQTGE